jgi:hypothetical protein
VAALRVALRAFERGTERAARSAGLPQWYLLLLLVKGSEGACRTPSTLDARVAHIALTEEGEQRFVASFRALADERRALREAIKGL